MIQYKISRGLLTAAALLGLSIAAHAQYQMEGFFIGANMSTPPTPNIAIVGGRDNPPASHVYQAENGTVGGGDDQRERESRQQLEQYHPARIDRSDLGNVDQIEIL